MNKTFLYTSLGCKVNQYEIRACAALFERAGFEVVGKNAAVCIVNTCCVTGESEAKSRRLIKRLRRENPNSVIAVTGCFSEINPETASLCGADIVVPNNDKDKLFELTCKYLLEKGILKEMPALCKGDIYIHSDRTRATVKVQDGCNNFCSYCIIPYARGQLKSKPVAEAVKEITALAKEGYKEVILTGIHLTRYGVDLNNGEDIVSLCLAVNEIDGIERIRFGSLEPGYLTEERVIRLKKANKLCPHFHLALQSGSDKVLYNMNRHYTSNDYINETKALKKHFENCAITTDIMVGFPQETEEDFNESLRVVEQVGFCKVHVFSFSARPGTPAAKMKKVPDNIKKQRSIKMLQAADICEEKYLNTFIGKELTVLFESKKNGLNRGFTENYMQVTVNTQEDLENTLRKVIITDVQNGICSGELNE